MQTHGRIKPKIGSVVIFIYADCPPVEDDSNIQPHIIEEEMRGPILTERAV
jgi:hypothetical protein